MIKQILKAIITAIIQLEARLVLKKYKPKIVGITGSVGKTGTKDVVAQVLGSHYRVRKSQKSFNSEIGVPLTILGCDNAWYSVSGWLKNIIEGLSLILFRAPYPEWLVLEIGVDRPGDIKRLIKWLKLDVAIITRLPEMPVHMEFFSSPAELINEKLSLVKAVGDTGVVILNYDDDKVMRGADRTRAKIITYGWNEGATVRGSNDHLLYREEGEVKIPDGLALKVDYQGNNVPIRIKGLLARHQLAGVLASIACGVSQGLNLVEITEALEVVESPRGRCRLIPGIKESLIIDDSYNSSPSALEAALQMLEGMEIKGRKIAVLGDMMELGIHTVEAHKFAGELVAKVCDGLIAVGVRAKFIADEAVVKKMNKKKVLHFNDVTEAGLALQALLQPGDVVLVKGSQSARLEKVVVEIMAHPEDREKLLVRQEPEWQAR